MKKKKSKNMAMVIEILVIIVVIIIIAIIRNNIQKDNSTRNGASSTQEESLMQEKTFEDISFKILETNYESSNFSIKLQINNNGTEKAENKKLQIVCLNENQEKIGIIYLALPDLGSGEGTELTVSINQDLQAMKDYRIEEYEQL